MITPISKAACPKARAGIQVLWAIACTAIDDLTFGTNHEVTAITIVVASPVNKWKKIEFEQDTAFFNQAKTRNKSAINVVQTISFVEPGLSILVRKALEDINGECCVHVIVRDNSGNYHYAGINYDPVTSEWWSADMRTGEGSSNTNTDPTADQAEYIETLTCNSLFYAPFFSGDASDIVV